MNLQPRDKEMISRSFAVLNFLGMCSIQALKNLVIFRLHNIQGRRVSSKQISGLANKYLVDVQAEEVMFS